MSKAQLSGIVGYTGYIRPSLQCTQLSSLKPGKHANVVGSYIPKGVDPFQDQESPQKSPLPESMFATAAAAVNESDYQSFQRQDRIFLENSRAVCNRAPATTAHWSSMHRSTFTDKTPDRHFIQSFRPELQPVLPSPTTVTDPAFESMGKATSFKGIAGDSHTKQVVLGAKRPPLMSTMSGAPQGDNTEGMNMSMTWPRKGSREQLTQRPPLAVREREYGTAKATGHPPGYMGHIPSPETGVTAMQHGTQTMPRPTQRCKEDTLFDSFREKPVGYLGYAPTSVYNRRSWEVSEVTNYGATNKSMVGMGMVPKRPEAGGTSTLLEQSFAGPLDGRPSDNGVFNSQIYFKLVRPLEGAARGHVPSATHPAGRKFMKPYLTMKNF